MGLFRHRPRIPPGRRLYAVGDVHGRLDLLGRIITDISSREGPFGSDGLTIVLLGDLIDRGPSSSDVIRLVRRCAAIFPDVVTLKGNHEDIMVAAWHGDRDALAGWLTVGGMDTLASFGVDPASLAGGDPDAIHAAMRRAVPRETIDWLEALPLSYECGDYLFVHAGIRPGLPLAQQEASDLLWIRDEFLDYRRPHGPVVVHGHTISERVTICPNRIGIDLGAYRTGRLAALRLEGATRKIVMATGDSSPDADD